MAKRTKRGRLTKEEVKKLVRDLPGILAGKKPTRYGLHKIFWGAVGHSLFVSIYDAFIVKSEGGVDDLGNSWDDLAQHTKAYKVDVREGGTSPNIIRRAKRNKQRAAGGEQVGLGLLTPGEYKEWKRIFGTIYHNYVDRYGESEAKQMAGQIAWTKLKEAGAVTKWDVLGNRDVLIMRRSERLSESLSPGNFDPNVGYRKHNKDQVFVLGRGSIKLGTSVEYAEMHNKTRPIWPEEMDLWLERATEAGRDAVVDRLEYLLS